MNKQTFFIILIFPLCSARKHGGTMLRWETRAKPEDKKTSRLQQSGGMKAFTDLDEIGPSSWPHPSH
jgi:hypothetical protein